MKNFELSSIDKAYLWSLFLFLGGPFLFFLFFLLGDSSFDEVVKEILIMTSIMCVFSTFMIHLIYQDFSFTMNLVFWIMKSYIVMIGFSLTTILSRHLTHTGLLSLIDVFLLLYLGNDALTIANSFISLREGRK